jgi:Lrp/AsnC family leucine-responsive transcriptional regulator
MTKFSLDRIDLAILEALQQDGRLSNVDLAAKVSLSPTPCLRRVKRLEEEGIIHGYRAQLNRRKIGLEVTAFVYINLHEHGPQAGREFLTSAAQVEEIVSCYIVTGAFDFLLEVVTPNLEVYSSVMLDRLGGLPGVKALQTSFVLRCVKEHQQLPLT